MVGIRGCILGDLHDRHSIVVEHRRDVFGREFVCGIADEETSLANGTVTDNHTPVKVR